MAEIESADNILNLCPACGKLIDVTNVEPFAQISCPSCQARIRVRTEFDHFTIEDLIGVGGMGKVYRVRDTTLNRQAALKILSRQYSKDRKRMAELEKEARLTASISHPHVVKVYSVGTDQGHFYIAMELVDQGSLEDWIRDGHKIREEKAFEIGVQVAEGLQAAFRQGLIHRDIKPGNILFADRDNAKLVDFGLALAFEHDTDDSGEVWATPFYVPPEKLERKPDDHRSDIYSLGASLFHAIAGRPPFTADTLSIEELKKIKSKTVDLRKFAPQVSAEGAAVINRMMAQDPEKRFQTYRELIHHLTEARRAMVHRQRMSPSSRAAEKRRRRRRRIGMVGLAFLLLAASAGTLLWVNRDAIFRKGDTVGAGVSVLPPDEEDQLPPDTAQGNTSTRFLQARKALFAGRYRDAENGFIELVQSAEMQQPTLNHARVNLGLCALLLGKSKESRKVFEQLAADGPYSDAPEDADMATFFVQLGTLMEKEGPVGAEAVGEPPWKGVRALTPLLAGLKNWESGDFKQAGVCLRQFQQTKIEPRWRWLTLNSYKMIAALYMDDLALLNRLEKARRVTTASDARKAYKDASAAHGKLKTKGKAADRLDRIILSLEDRIEELEKEERIASQKEMARLLEEETQRAVEVNERVKPYLEDYRIDEALAELKAVSFKHPDAASLHAVNVSFWSDLHDFFDLLIQDINRFGFVGDIDREGGGSIRATVRSATRDELSLELLHGKTTLAWEDIPPREVMAIASALLAKSTEPADRNKRQICLSIFAYRYGEVEYAERLAEILEVTVPGFMKRWHALTGGKMPTGAGDSEFTNPFE